eukprot:SAG31_NODE_905_length_11119_cov_2.887931_7_plen_136_part_00
MTALVTLPFVCTLSRQRAGRSGTTGVFLNVTTGEALNDKLPENGMTSSGMTSEYMNAVCGCRDVHLVSESPTNAAFLLLPIGTVRRANVLKGLVNRLRLSPSTCTRVHKSISAWSAEIDVLHPSGAISSDFIGFS